MFDPESENKETLMSRLRMAALSGGLAGAGLGSIGSLLKGAKGAEILKAALAGGATGAVSTPAAIGTGHLIMGEPNEGEQNPHTRRGAIGGALLGGLAGIGGAALLRNRLPLARMGSLGSKVASGLEADNILVNKVRDLVKSSERAKMLSGLGLGGVAGGAAGGYLGADEGMGLDVVQNEINAAKKRKQMRDLQRMTENERA